MKLQQTFIYQGIKRICVGKPIHDFCSIKFIEYVDYGIPLHKQQRVRVYLSELEQDMGVSGDGCTVSTGGFDSQAPANFMGDASNRKTEGLDTQAALDSHEVHPYTSPATIIEWPFGEVRA